METRRRGIEGEVAAKEFLIAEGYNITECNYSVSFGEIDIIARKDKTVIFVEVKNRYGTEYGEPIESVTPYKISKIARVAEYYMTVKRLNGLDARFDVITVKNGEVEEHIKNAFTASDGNYRRKHW